MTFRQPERSQVQDFCEVRQEDAIENQIHPSILLYIYFQFNTTNCIYVNEKYVHLQDSKDFRPVSVKRQQQLDFFR